VDKNRRKFLKIIFIGSGALIMEKILGPFFSTSFGQRVEAPLVDKPKKRRQTAFNIVDNNEVFSVYDESGEQIFEIDKRQ